MVVISITGTPGTGKSTLSKVLLSFLNAKKHFKDDAPWIRFDVTQLIKDNSLYDSKDEDGTLVVDEKKLVSFLLKKISENIGSNIIVDSFFSHYLPSSIVDMVVVCNCDISVLTKRLTQRGYSLSKVRENVEAEIVDVCGSEAEERSHNIIRYYSDNQTTIEFSKYLEHLLIDM